MSQQNVFDVLKESKRAMTAKEIYENLRRKNVNISLGSVQVNLLKLSKSEYAVIRITMSGNRQKYILRDYATVEHLEQEHL